MHHHHHHNHNHDLTISTNGQKKILIGCLIINLLFVAIEAITGYLCGSISLMSDAGHNLSDVLGLLLALIGIILSQSHNNDNKKISNYVSFLNALLLIVAVIYIGIESYEKIINPTKVDGIIVIITSIIAIIINGITAAMLLKGSDKNINIKAAYLHAATDALVSIGVLISGIIISLTGYFIIDGIISFIITIIIAVPSLKLLIETIKRIL